MIRKKIALIIVLSLLTPVFAAAQTADKQESAKQEPTKTEEDKKAREEMEKKAFALVDEIIKEALSLRLPENRIRIQALLGDMLWKRDERRARILFKQATDGLIELIAQTGSPLNIYSPQNVLIMQTREQLKQEVLNIIAQRDPKYAREFLRSVRASSPEQNANNANIAQYEMDYGQELRLASQIAVTDPAQALQIAEESIPKGLRMEMVGIFNQIASKDREMGDKLLSAIMKNLRATNLSENDTAASFALSLMQLGINGTDNDDEDEDEKAVKVDQLSRPGNNDSPVLNEKVIRELMEMLAAAALSNSKPSRDEGEGYGEGWRSYLLTELNSIIKEVEKYAPSRASQISRKAAQSNRKVPPEEKFYKEQERVLSNGSVDEVLETAKKAPDELRDALYQQAATKALGEGDESRARQIINDNISNPVQREQFLNTINNQAAFHTAALGKIEETRQLLNRIPPEQRTEVMIQLANSLASKGEKKIALQVIDEARGLIGSQPANYTELLQLLSISRAYVSIEAMRGFEIIESIIDQLNTLFAAAAILDGFDYARYFREGELVPQSSGLLTTMAMQCVKDIALLAKNDFDRAKLAADRFQRSELRTLARLYVAEGVLSDKQQQQERMTFLHDGLIRIQTNN